MFRVDRLVMVGLPLNIVTIHCHFIKAVSVYAHWSRHTPDLMCYVSRVRLGTMESMGGISFMEPSEKRDLT